MLTNTGLEALENLWDAGGRLHLFHLASRIGRSSSYTRLLCNSLGKDDYLDFSASGICEITAKGEGELRKRKMMKRAIIEGRGRNHRSEEGMLNTLIQFMARDGIFAEHDGEKEWLIGRIKCFTNKMSQGWALVVIASDISRFIATRGWGGLLGTYIARLDAELNLTDYVRILPDGMRKYPEIERLLRRIQV